MLTSAIDLIIQDGRTLHPVEVKTSATVRRDASQRGMHPFVGFVITYRPLKSFFALTLQPLKECFMKRRRMLLAYALALVISATAALTACSSEHKETTAESNSPAGQVIGVWEAYDVYDPKQGTMTESGYSQISEQFQAIYAFNFAEDGIGSFIRFGVQKPFTWTVDGDGKITVTLEGTAGTFTGQIDASAGRLRLKGPDETDAELK